ncbi:MAG: hypothetical protein ACPG1C_12335 [Alphaproteobacteria bacterium]
MMKDLPSSETMVDALFNSTINRGVDEGATYLTLHTVILAELVDRLHRLPADMRSQFKIDEERGKLLHPDFDLPSAVHEDVVYLSMLAHEVVFRVQQHYAAINTAH